MRIISTTPAIGLQRREADTADRSANIEFFGLLAGAAVVLLGLWLTHWGNLQQDAAEHAGSHPINVRRVQSPDALVPLLTMFDRPAERQLVARALFARATAENPSLQHVGGLAGVAIRVGEIEADRRYVRLRARVQQRPGATEVPVLSPADIAVLKPHATLRTA